MATNSSNSNSKTQFDNMKYEIAGQLGINLKQGYNGDLTSREAGTIGGKIVKKVFRLPSPGRSFRIELHRE